MLQSSDGKIILLRKTPRGKRGGVKHRKAPRDGESLNGDVPPSPSTHAPDGADSDHSSSDVLSIPLSQPPPPPPPRDSSSPTRVQSIVSALNQQHATTAPAPNAPSSPTPPSSDTPTSAPPPADSAPTAPPAPAQPLDLLALSPSASPNTAAPALHSPDTPASAPATDPTSHTSRSSTPAPSTPAAAPSSVPDPAPTPEQKRGVAAADLAAAREQQAADAAEARRVEVLMRELEEMRDAKQRAEEAQEQLTIQAQCLLQEKSRLLQSMTQRERQIMDLQERLEYVEQECEDLRQVGVDGLPHDYLGGLGHEEHLGGLGHEDHLGLDGLLADDVHPGLH